MDRWLHLTLYWAYGYLFMFGLNVTIVVNGDSGKEPTLYVLTSSIKLAWRFAIPRYFCILARFSLDYYKHNEGKVYLVWWLFTWAVSFEICTRLTLCCALITVDSTHFLQGFFSGIEAIKECLNARDVTMMNTKIMVIWLSYNASNNKTQPWKHKDIQKHKSTLMYVFTHCGGLWLLTIQWDAGLMGIFILIQGKSCTNAMGVLLAIDDLFSIHYRYIDEKHSHVCSLPFSDSQDSIWWSCRGRESDYLKNLFDIRDDEDH